MSPATAAAARTRPRLAWCGTKNPRSRTGAPSVRARCAREDRWDADETPNPHREIRSTRSALSPARSQTSRPESHSAFRTSFDFAGFDAAAAQPDLGNTEADQVPTRPSLLKYRYLQSYEFSQPDSR